MVMMMRRRKNHLMVMRRKNHHDRCLMLVHETLMLNVRLVGGWLEEPWKKMLQMQMRPLIF
jgi:hypothetical protein